MTKKELMYKEADAAAAAAAKAAEVEAVRWVLRGEYTEESTGARTIRQSGGKDRHSKVFTARGPRDRRVRLSVATAIRFYDLQDRLGVDQPSKAVDWLMRQAHAAIDALPPLITAAQALAPPPPHPPPPRPPVHGSVCNDDDDDDDVDADDPQYSATGSATSDQKPYASFLSPQVLSHSHKRLRQSDYSSPENQAIAARHVDVDQFSACSSSSCATTVNDTLIKLFNNNNNNNNNHSYNNLNHGYDTLIYNHNNNSNNSNNTNTNNNVFDNNGNSNNNNNQIDSSYASSLTLLQAFLMKPKTSNLVDTKPTTLFPHHHQLTNTTPTTNFAPPPHHGHLLDALYHIPSPSESISSMHHANNCIPTNTTTTAATTTSNSQYVPNPTLPTSFHVPMSSSAPNYEQHSANYGSLYIL